MMSESSKRHSKFLSLIFILKCLSKASVIRIIIITCLNRMTISVIKTAINMGPVKAKK